MARTLNLTKAGEYAIAALSRLAQTSPMRGRSTIPVSALAREQKIPAAFLSKIIAQCGRAGLLRSSKGRLGGVALARPPERITLLEIIEACEGRYGRESCLFFSSRRCPGTECPVYCGVREEEDTTRVNLSRVTLADLADSLARHPDARVPVAAALDGAHEQL